MNFADHMTESSISIILHCSDQNLHPVPTLNGKKHKVIREINFVESPQKDGTCKIQWRRELLYIKLVDCSRGKVAHISMPASQTLGILSFKIYTTNRLNW
jgi:hypothetical protein